MTPRRLGVFGGTFDPVHVGHLVAAVNARAALDLDTVLLVVANLPWQKIGERTISDAGDRLAMVAAAAASADGIEASAIEIQRGGSSYTADTLSELHRHDPSAELFVIVGADVVSGLGTWERVDEVRTGATLVVVNRPGSDASPMLGDLGAAGWRVEVIEVPALEISSTDLRERARTGRPLDYLVPDGAIAVIRDRDLYALGR
ncbi:MAG TPA: nicotinate-nucleotide adenylyltransferase [Acidimicrobiales bacterium]